MRYSLSTSHLEITAEDQTLIDKKLSKLDRILHEPYVTDIRLKHDTHHGKGDVVSCTINIEQGKRVFHAERSRETIQDALDECIAAIHQELTRFYGKHSSH